LKLKDVVSRIEIDPRKLVEYALNPNSQSGGASKAILFERCLGFTQENYEVLLEQIQEKALDAEASISKLNEYGQRYQVNLEIIGIEGQRETVKTGWIVRPDSTVAQLTTLYVSRRKAK
jgi:hypothetical protein